ncbi:MAG: DUF1801 domain-containing protein [Weeksellaceae bacterium]|nr:DUF1801 domain-containing protein [Weeksellaceae bacterium]
MANVFSTIEEYIDTFEGDKKNILHSLSNFIQNLVPEAKPTINYKMPTYKLNGNLIHFAMFKNHVGIYPGEDMIELYKDDLKNYKTSKGTIQIQLDQEIPFDTLQKIILHKVEILKNKEVPDWKKYHDQYADITNKLVEIVSKTDLVKEFKWGGDIYTYNGKNVLAFSGFKNHYSLWFHNGVFLEDKAKVLISANEEKTKALRQWRFKSIEDLDTKLIESYIKEAIQIAKEGKELILVKEPPKEPQGILKEALEQDQDLHKAFFALTPGRRKDYIEYIDEAKQEKTKINRLNKIKPIILEGKGLYDKYKS